MHLSLSIDKDVILARLAAARQNHQLIQSVSLIVITVEYDLAEQGLRAKPCYLGNMVSQPRH